MPRAIDSAVATLDGGGLVVYPTDTLYGLGARALNPAAVARVSAVKHRPDGMPISIAVSSTEEVDRWTRLQPAQRTLVRRLLPGPVTLLLPSSADAQRRLADAIIGVDGSIGVRVPDHPVARELARRVGPLTSTSANLHGSPSPHRLADVRRQLGNDVDQYLAVGPTPSGRPSTLVDLRGREPREIRRS